jgi:DNA modification methylase
MICISDLTSARRGIRCRTHKLMDADPKSPQQEGRPSAFHAAPCSPLLDSILCADNCEALKAMPSEFVDLVVTSPPYDDLRTYGGHSWNFDRLASELTRVLKTGGVIVWNVADQTQNGSESGTSFEQALGFKRLGLWLYDTMIWDKTNITTPTEGRYYDVWEYMFVLSKGKPSRLNLLTDRKNIAAGGTYRSISKIGDEARSNKTLRVNTIPETSRRHNIWRIAPERGVDGHPAPFPQALASDHIQSWSNPGDVVLDPFAGSGTTLKAAKELNRRFIGIEINPEYVAICKRRIAQDVLPLFSENKQIIAPGGEEIV